MLIDLYNGQTNFDLRLITLELSTQTSFIDVLSPHYLIVIKILIFYMNKGNVPLFMLSLMHQLIYKGICEQTLELCPPCMIYNEANTYRPYSGCLSWCCSEDLSTTESFLEVQT